MTIGVLEALFIQGKLSRVVLLTWYLVCGFGVLVLCLFWVIRGRIARKVHFYGKEAPPGIPEGRTEEEMQDCTEDEHFAHPELWDPGRSCGLIPAGFPLQGVCRLWVCVGTGSVSDPLPQVSGDHEELSVPLEQDRTFLWWLLAVLLPPSPFTSAQKDFHIPLPGRHNCTRFSPWLKWQLSNLLGFFSSPRIMGFILK